MSHAPCQPTSLASRLRLMKLEPRMLFDGAAVAEAVAADTSHDAATAHETEQTAPTPVATAAPATDVTPPGAYGPDVAAELSYFAADGLPPEFQEAAAEASRSILDFARQASDETWYALFNGGGDAADPAWTARLDALRADLLAGNVVLAVQAIDASAMPDAVAAFTASGPDGGMTIFVNTAWTRLLDTPDLARTLVEEFGHAIDYRLNEGRDTPGDEGETFAAEVLGWSEDATRVALENDRRVIEWNGASYVVETATFAFVNAYAVTNLPLSKEQSSVTFDSAAPLGTAVVDDQDFNSKYFSGNDVSAVGLDIGGQLYYGWISRPIKSGGVVRGFYFWTDVNFTDWAKAQADGNQDGDGNPADNQGFVLVVDQAWFDAQGAGSITVGTSSDRVDTAINKEIDKVLENPPPPLVTAGADIADGSNGSVEGVDGDPGVNASGNVLTNDSSLNAGALTVTQISGSGNSASAVSGGTPGSVSGKYGTLTIDANGDYSYVVNNANPTVDALNEGGTLNDVFTYTVTDSKGVAVSATLTVAIQGANDSPNANPDANVAKNHLATNDPGFNATGNVLTNDTDVDSSRADMYVDTDSLLVTGAVDAGTVTIDTNPPVIGIAFGNNSTKAGDSVYYAATLGSVSAIYRMYAADGTTAITLSAGGASPALSGIPAYYKDANGVLHAIDLSQPLYVVPVAANKAITDEITGNGNTSTTATVTLPSPTTLSDLTGITGTLAKGMTVSGANVPAGTTITDVIRDANGNVTSIKLSTVMTSDAAGQHITFSAPPAGGNTLQGAYGTLTLDSDGGYTYTANTAGGTDPVLTSGQTAVEVFNYTMVDQVSGKSSNSTLSITVYGSSANDPILKDHAGTAKESGVQPGGNTVETGSNASDNVLTGNGAGGTTDLSATATVVSFGLAGSNATTNANGALVGAYGTLTLNSNGSYTYVVNNADATVNALPVGSSLTETFVYQVKNTANTGASFARLTITIQGTNDAPTAGNDAAVAKKAGLHTASGSVLVNDADVDTGETATLQVARAGLSSADTAVVGQAEIVGVYGALTLQADGSYVYVLDTNATATRQLGAGQTATETFTYEIIDAHGATATATLTIDITGANEAPVNKMDGQSFSDNGTTTVTTAINTAIDFTGDKTLTVNDADGNLAAITLEVEHGLLSLTGNAPGGVTVTALDGGLRLRIEITGGTESDLNAALALLRYTPEANFMGVDFLTLASADGAPLWDSDGIAIVIPSISEISLNEAALASGSTPGSSAESYADTLTVPAGQVIPTREELGLLTGSGATPQGGDLKDALGAIVGVWEVAPSGAFSVTLTVASQANGAQAEFHYLTLDLYGNSIENTVKVNISDDAPSAVNDTAAADMGETVTGNALTGGAPDTLGADGPATGGGVIGARAAAGDTATPVSTGVGAAIVGNYGTLTLEADGSYSYVANASIGAQQVTDTFVYTIEDADGSRSTATLVITVTDNSAPAANTAPTDGDESVSTAEDTPVSGNVLANASDVDGDTLTVTGFTVAGDATPYAAGQTAAIAGVGSLTIEADGAYTFTPAANYNGAVPTVTYTVSDGTATDTSTLTITVTAVNDAPTAADVTTSTAFNTPKSGTLPAIIDVDGDPNLTYAKASDPAHGSVTVNSDGSYTYTPTTGYSGADSFTYTVSDGNGGSNAYTVNITIGGNTPAEFGGVDSGGVTEDSGSYTASGAVTVTDPDPGEAGVVVKSESGAYGAFSINAGGIWTYTADNNALQSLGAGVTATDVFSIQSVDGQTYNITITLTGVNDAPLAADQTISTAFNTAYNGNLPAYTDIDSGDTVTYAKATDPGYGTVTIDTDGSYTYTPTNGFTGQDSFAYTVSDDEGGSSTHTVTINIGAGTAASFGGTNTGGVTEDGTLTASGQVTVSDSDPGEDSVITQSGVAGVYGSFSIDAAGNWSYTADNAKLQSLSTAAQATETFTIVSADGTQHNIVITINGVNDAPTAANDSITTAFNTAYSGNLPAHSGEVDTGHSVTYAKASDPGHGTVTVNADGSYVYTPTTGYTGTDSFTYSVNDGVATNTYTVSITIGSSTGATFSGTNAGSVTEDDTLTASGKVTVTDPDPGEASVIAQTDVAGVYGKFSIDTVGNWTYTADNAKLQALSGVGDKTETFTVKSADGTQHNIVITVDGVNDAPTAANDSITTAFNTAYSGNLPAHSGEVDTGHSVTYAKASDPGHGTVTVNADGSYVYTPTTGYTGTDSFTYSVSDGVATNTYTVSITISNNVPATFSGKSADSVTEDSGSYSVAGQIAVTDPDSPATIVAQTDVGGKYGVFSIDAAGNWSYVADNGKLQPLSQTAQDTDVFTIQSADGAEHDITITLNGVNDAPVAADTSISTAFNTATSGTLPSASDVDSGHTATYAKGSDPAHGTVTVDANGDYTYTPTTGYSGADSFTYTVSDSKTSNTYTVNITTANSAAPPSTMPPPSASQAPQSLPLVRSGDSALAPDTIGISLHVLVAVQEVQEKTSGIGWLTDDADVSPTGAALMTDSSLHVLPAVEEAWRSYRNAENARRWAERIETLRAANGKHPRFLSLEADDDLLLEQGAPGAGDAAPPTDPEAADGEAAADAPVWDEREETSSARDAAVSAARIITGRADIATQLQRLASHRSTTAQAVALARQLAERPRPAPFSQPAVI